LYACGFTNEQVNSHLTTASNIPRDFFITTDDVRNICSSAGSTNAYKLNKDDASSVDQWVRASAGSTFAYVRQNRGGGAGNEASPFTLGVMTKQMLAALLAYGDAAPLIIDSTFGTNLYAVRSFFRACTALVCVAVGGVQPHCRHAPSSM